MAHFQTKNPNLSTFLRVLQLKMLVYLIAVLSTFYCHTYGIHILWSLGIFYVDLVYILLFWYALPREIWQPCSETVAVHQNL
jgi:hypothetical protein